MIGTLSGISYRTFTVALAPVAAIALAVTYGAIVLMFPREFGDRSRVEVPAFDGRPPLRIDAPASLEWQALRPPVSR